MANLAAVYSSQGKYPQAEVLYDQALEIQRRVLPEHQDTLSNMNGLATAYASQGKYPQAEALYNQTLEIQRRVLGPEHPSTLSSMNGLANAYRLQGKYPQAEALYNQALEIRRSVLGPEHPSTLSTMTELASVNQAQRKFSPGESLAREAVEAYRAKRPDDWQRFYAESVLGANLAGQKKYAEAEPLLLAGYQGMAARKEKIAVSTRRRLEWSRDWPVELDQAWGKQGKATEWKKE
jgi:tetratricopeptide (TPR) repeat protein